MPPTTPQRLQDQQSPQGEGGDSHREQIVAQVADDLRRRGIDQDAAQEVLMDLWQLVELPQVPIAWAMRRAGWKFAQLRRKQIGQAAYKTRPNRVTRIYEPLTSVRAKKGLVVDAPQLRWVIAREQLRHVMSDNGEHV